MSLEKLSQLIEEELKTFDFDKDPQTLYAPIHYMLSLGGKRMRPKLVLIGYSLFKPDPETMIRPALAVEVFHNFTLMHDDIMDNAPVRRGQPTIHERWSATSAILSGDAMMIQAYQLLEDLQPDLMARALRLFNQTALEVCEGQQIDMDMEQTLSVTVEDYLGMIRLKTAVLLGFSLQFGALLAGAREEEQKLLYNIGVDLGMAFQLMDDHLDTFGDESFGKKIGGDILANKKTFLMITALESSHKDELLTWLNKKASDEKIDAVTQLYRQAGVEKLSREKILEYASDASDALNKLEVNNEAKGLLESYIHQLSKRVH